ncbi:hypothetical protein ACFL59_05880 [Planctomycetota bacterium]
MAFSNGGGRGRPEGRGREDGRFPRYRESSRCRTPGCVKFHDFFQWNGKYYCLECYETLREAEKTALAT